MPLERNGLARFLALLVLAALSMPPAASWADGGGAGVQFQIQYDENADEDEDDEEPGNFTLPPVGFGSELRLKYELSPHFSSGVTYTPEPTTAETTGRESGSGVTLGGPSLSEDKITYFTPRFNARFPSISYTPVELGTAIDVGEPIEPSATFEIKPRLERWTWLWAGETAVEEVAKDPTPRVGYSLSFNEKDDLRLRASYTMWEDDAEKAQPQASTQQASAGSASLTESLKTMSTVQAVQTAFGVSEERAEAFVDGVMDYVLNERARNFLSDDTYRKLQAEFGPVANGASGGTGTQPYTSGSAADHSGWSGARLYCGGACVYGF
jgi:hypothetical protein